MAISRRDMNAAQKALLDSIATLVKAYNEMCLSPLYSHSKTVITFEGQRYKVADIQRKWRKRHEKENG